MTKSGRVFWMCLLIVAVIGIISLGTLSLSSVDQLEKIGNYFSRDGQISQRMLDRISRLRPVSIVVGGLLLVFIGFLFHNISRQLIEKFINQVSYLAGIFKIDAYRFFSKFNRLQWTRFELIPLILILLVAFFSRMVLLPSPLTYDEPYSFMGFAIQPFSYLISDYHLPNNHIFHTILMHFTIHLIGDEPWMFRLPVFISGLLVVVLVFDLGRIWYGRECGLIAAALAAWMPVLIAYSVDARGYMLVTMFSLMLLRLGDYLLKDNNWAVWVMFAITAALGFYTVPTMAYPFGITCTWLSLSAFSGEVKPNYSLRIFFTRMIFMCALTGALTILLYLPVLIKESSAILIANTFVRSYPWPTFIENFPGWMSILVSSLFREINQVVAWVILGGVIVSLIFHRKIAKTRVPLLAATIIFFVVILPIQRPELHPKVFVFMVPLLLIWTAAGWVVLIKIFLKKASIPISNFLSWFVVAMILISAFLQALPNRNYLTGYFEEAEQVVLWLGENVTPGDAVLVDFPFDPQVWYYARKHGIPLSIFQHLERYEFQRAYVVVFPRLGQDVQGVIEHRQPSNRPLDFNSRQQVAIIGDIKIYLAWPEKP